jgi:hypothetical protein
MSSRQSLFESAPSAQVEARVIPLPEHLAATDVACGGAVCFLLCDATGEPWAERGP